MNPESPSAEIRGHRRSELDTWHSARSVFQGAGGSTEALRSTGIFRTAASSLTLNPAYRDAAALPHGPGRVRQPPSAHGRPQHGVSSPPPPQARLAPFWAFHSLLYASSGSQQSQASTSSEEIVKGHNLRNKGIGGLYITLVTLGLCAFIWLVTAATLSSQATALGVEAEEGEEEPAAVLRLEDSSAPLPFIRLGDEPRNLRGRTYVDSQTCASHGGHGNTRGPGNVGCDCHEKHRRQHDSRSSRCKAKTSHYS
ncbi:hypothetical protein MRX96_026281 [Rhipicephalus microplus]